jgi:hypothetical protein
MIEKMFNFQMKYILVLNHKDSYKLSGNQVNNIVLIVSKNELHLKKKIYTEYMHGGLLAGITRSSFFMRLKTRMGR